MAPFYTKEMEVSNSILEVSLFHLEALAGFSNTSASYYNTIEPPKLFPLPWDFTIMKPSLNRLVPASPRDYITNPAERIGNIPSPTRNEVEVTMRDRLPGIDAGIYPEIERRGLGGK